jgi:hypothetical protein
MRRQSTPGHRLNSGSFGTMGVGLRFAVGAKAAKPDTQVICLHGDGSFGQNAMEFDTAVRLKLPPRAGTTIDHQLGARAEPPPFEWRAGCSIPLPGAEKTGEVPEAGWCSLPVRGRSPGAVREPNWIGRRAGACPSPGLRR